MRKRVFKKLQKNGYGTYERVGDQLVHRIADNCKTQMKTNRDLRKDIRALVTRVLMRQVVT